MRLRPMVEEQFWRNEGRWIEIYMLKKLQQQFQCQIAEETGEIFYNFWIG